MKVPLLDLKDQYGVIKDEILKAANEVFESQYFILGPRVELPVEKEDQPHIQSVCNTCEEKKR
jgi:hypothetical protein